MDINANSKERSDIGPFKKKKKKKEKKKLKLMYCKLVIGIIS